MSEPGEVRGAPSKVDKMRTPELAAAVLAVKGAVQEVLGKRTTSSFVYNSKSKGRLAVVYQGEAPSEDQVKRVEAAVNAAIAQALPITVTRLPRAEAEATYGQGLYDKLRPPAELTELTVVRVGSDWVVATAKEGAFPPDLGALPRVLVPRANHRPQKEELEFVFELTEDKVAPASATSAPAAPATAAAPILAAAKGRSLEAWSGELQRLIAEALAPEALDPATQQRILARTGRDTQALLHALLGQAYAAGFKAKMH